MNRWLEDFKRPVQIDLADWFTRLADRLLNETQLLIADEPYRIIEIEFYYNSANHPDPFTHANPLQAEIGRWYFHRSHGAYRGGSFKGLDITFGDSEARAGILIRSLMSPKGTMISGPSLFVDHILAQTKHAKVADLDSVVGKHRVWDRGSCLRLVESSPLAKEVLSSSRVGLTMRRARADGKWAEYLVRPYRFLTEPHRIKKGKAQMAIALHRLGNSIEVISRTIGCNAGIIRRYITEYAAGRAAGRFEEYFGCELSSVDICRIHGVADFLAHQ